MATHHLDDATVVRYASGDLDEAYAVVAASHVAGCATCRKAVADAEAVAGEMLETDEPEALSNDAIDRMLELSLIHI